jgi:hypothetical protein
LKRKKNIDFSGPEKTGCYTNQYASQSF